MANFSYTDGFVSSVAPEIQEWAAKEIPYFRTFDQNIATPNGTIAERLESFENYNNAQLAVQGLTLSGNRTYKMNLFTSYSFSQGSLKGLRVGGGYLHQSKLPIGQYTDGSLQYGNSYWDSHAMIGYRFSRTAVPWLKRLSLQLNVMNVFNEDDSYVYRRTQDTPGENRRIRVREPRSWRLTANFEF
jgi:outer membrane receptor for monomeric catechols